jgi:hypothetical protein
MEPSRKNVELMKENLISTTEADNGRRRMVKPLPIVLLLVLTYGITGCRDVISPTERRTDLRLPRNRIYSCRSILVPASLLLERISSASQKVQNACVEISNFQHHVCQGLTNSSDPYRKHLVISKQNLVRGLSLTMTTRSTHRKVSPLVSMPSKACSQTKRY